MKDSDKYGGIRGTPYDPEDIAPTQWLWKYKLVKNAVNLLVGDAGVGKSTLIAHLIAGMTNGKLPDYAMRQPLRVGVIANEDSRREVWHPRLRAANARKGWITTIDKGDFGQINITAKNDPGLMHLVDYIRDNKLRVVYFDQLLDHLGDINTYSQSEVRQALMPLKIVASEARVTFLATMHPNKRAENFAQLMAGSGAFQAIARSVLYVAHHPEDEGVRVLTVGKGNYAPPGQQAYEFNLVPEYMRVNGHRIETTRISAIERTDMTVDELMKLKPMNKKPVSVEIEAALRHFLQDGDWHLRNDFVEEVVFAGNSERTVLRVAKRIGVVHKTEGFQGPTLWQLPIAKDKLKAKR